MKKIIAFLTLALGATLAAHALEINKANQAELESLKGVGPAMATRILDERKTGDYKNWAELIERVKGVGPKSAAKLSEAGLTVQGAAYTAAVPVAKADAKH